MIFYVSSLFSFLIPWYPKNRSCLEIKLAAGAHSILSMVQPWQLGRKVLFNLDVADGNEKSGLIYEENVGNVNL